MKHYFLGIAILMAFLSIGCTSTNLMMKQPLNYVQMNKDDFEFSDQLTGEATATYILTIDFERLFNVKTGDVNSGMPSIPVIGSYMSSIDLSSRAKSYALYDLMQKNPGYDVVFYPQYEVVRNAPIGISWLICTYTVKVTARLAKVRK